jgi:predicted DNA-binding transcriptional regulator AlpA
VARKVSVDRLVGAAEIAKKLGYSNPEYVHDLRRRYDDFPEPLKRLAAGFVWDWADVEAWAKATGRLK